MKRLGNFAIRRRRWILWGALVAAILAGAFGGTATKLLSTGGFTDPTSESQKAENILEQQFHTGNPNMVLLITAKGGSVDDPAVAAQGAAVTKQLAGEPGIQQAVSYWTLGSPPPLRSKAGNQALVLARIEGDDDEVRERIDVLSPKYTRSNSVIAVGVGGQAEVFRQVGIQVENDLRKAESITFPVVLLLLVLVFGSVLAAGLPLAIAGIAVVGTLLVLRILVGVTDVSIYALNLTTAMGIGLGVDYALFIVSRFREELRAGYGVTDAVITTVETAGRTVLFSALTVAVSLSALLVFPLYFLRSFAYAGIAVVALAALGAIVVLPALLATLGVRVDSFTLWKHKPKEVGEGFWHRLATFVMHRPVRVTLAVVAVLVLLGLPFLNVRFGLPDDRVLPESATSRQVQEAIRTDFVSEEAAALSVVAPTAGPPGPALQQKVATYAAELSRLPGVARVDAITGSYVQGQQALPPSAISQRFAGPAGKAGTWLSMVPGVEPLSSAGEALAKDVREAPAPFDTLVTGASAQLVDSKSGIFGRLPLALGIIALVTFAVLFMMTGSVVVPLKALVLNMLSLSATFGAMVWIFQEGHLSNLLNFTATGSLDSSNPILMFCIAFGLSMDYEVFLLSRIKEEHDRTGDNISSVAIGLERTGRIVTAAAALLAVVFIAFSNSDVSFIKMFGIGMSLAVIMDATLVRGGLVPAFMRLAGNANWWAPRPLRRFHDRFGLSEGAPPKEPETVGEPQVVEPVGAKGRRG
ncbi:MAG TPA: MMPL family transporter [Actinomycetota bacterium]|nr:MMPL family transporter [Actinomycetota bacterium]